MKGTGTAIKRWLVPVDCVASIDEEAHRFALEHMEKILGAKLITLGGVSK